MTRILIADDHHLFRRQLRNLIEAQPDWVVCSEAADGREAVEQHGSVAPQLTVMDFNMPNMDGIKASSTILLKNPEAQILMITVFASRSLADEAKKTGIRGFCSKSSDCIVDGIQALLRGETYFPSFLH